MKKIPEDVSEFFLIKKMQKNFYFGIEKTDFFYKKMFNLHFNFFKKFVNRETKINLFPNFF